MTFLPDFDKTTLISDMTPAQLQVLKGQLEGEVASLQAKLAWLNDQLTTVQGAIDSK